MEEIIERVHELAGGRDKFWKLANTEIQEISTKWDRNIEVIGRILRAHLFVEHFLTEHLQRRNPQLGPLTKAKLSYAQKVDLIDPNDEWLSTLIPGLRRLGSLRNRLAHQIEAGLEASDLAVFLQCAMFAAFRTEGAKPGAPSDDPLDVMEAFARFAANWLHMTYSEVSRLMRVASLEIRLNLDL
jgi:hypothetical protein